MTKKRYFAAVASFAVLALAAGALYQSKPALAAGGRQIIVPKSYGMYKGTAGPALVFEDSNGTLSLVDLNQGGEAYASIVRR